jgi:hypothetical protein
MVFKCLAAFFGSYVAGVWLFAYKLFLYHNIIFGFKGLGVAGQVTVGHAQQFFKRVKVGILIYHKYTHNAQPNTVVKRLVYML